MENMRKYWKAPDLGSKVVWRSIFTGSSKMIFGPSGNVLEPQKSSFLTLALQNYIKNTKNTNRFQHFFFWEFRNLKIENVGKDAGREILEIRHLIWSSWIWVHYLQEQGMAIWNDSIESKELINANLLLIFFWSDPPPQPFLILTPASQPIKRSSDEQLRSIWNSLQESDQRPSTWSER